MLLLILCIPWLSILCAPFGHISKHLPQLMQRSGYSSTSFLAEIDSGLWDQMHRRLHPFEKTVILTPGPS